MPEVDGILGTSELPRIVELVRQAASRHDWATSAPPGYLYDATTPRLLTAQGALRVREDRRGLRHGLHLLRDPAVPRQASEPRRCADIVARGRGARRARRAGGDPRLAGHARVRPRSARATATSATCCWRSARRACRGSGRCTCIPRTSTTGCVEKWAQRARRAVHRHAGPARATTRVLKSMRRAVTARRMKDIVAQFRAAIPDVTVRTTVLVGFPGETDGGLRAAAGVRRRRALRSSRRVHVLARGGHAVAGVRRPGAPPRSPPSARAVVQERAGRDRLGARTPSSSGSVMDVLVDGPSEDPAFAWEGRTAGQAPEIDGVVYLRGRARLHARPLRARAHRRGRGLRARRRARLAGCARAR